MYSHTSQKLIVQPCITKITEANDLKQTATFSLKMHHPGYILQRDTDINTAGGVQ